MDQMFIQGEFVFLFHKFQFIEIEYILFLLNKFIDIEFISFI